MLVQLRVSSLAPVTEIAFELAGVGTRTYQFLGQTLDDGRYERAFAPQYPQVPVGVWPLTIRAMDAWGCRAQTGVRRLVTVQP